MMTVPCTSVLALALLAPATPLLPVGVPPQAQGPSPVEIAALHARFDPSLDSLRAGAVTTPASLDPHERAELTAAQENGGSLDALRAGDGPSDNQWKWLAIGAGIVLLIVLL